MSPETCINNVLCYISTAKHSCDQQTIISMCMAFYKEDEINKAKEVLYKSADETFKKRIGDGRMKNNICDMLQISRKFDESDSVLPKFLCDGYNKMPPSAGFEVIAEHIFSLLSKMESLETEINLLKSHDISGGFIEIKEDIKDIKLAVNKVPKTALTSQRNFESARNLLTVVEVVSRDGIAVDNSSSEDVLRTSSPPCEQDTVQQQRVLRDFKPRRNSVKDETIHIEDATSEEEPDGQPWTKVQRRKPRIFVTGSKNTAGQFKGVQPTKDIYIGRCDKNVSVSHIEEYIKGEFGVDFVQCSCISNEIADVKSFKITVFAQTSDEMLDTARWPQNVRVRRYFNKFYMNHGSRK